MIGPWCSPEIARCVSLLAMLSLLVVHQPARASDPNLEVLDAGELKAWVGHPRSAVLSAWGNPAKIELQGREEYLNYAFFDTRIITEADESVRYDEGPTIQGFDADVMRLLQQALRKSCFVKFTVIERKVSAIELIRFKGADDCDESLMHLPPDESS